ncbi:MAG: baseplate J/gp47 family protein [Lachnospiraceae bacterium]|nr:baseplate J/gp47 family protein [Lachnospiraceae bacterium]
MMQLDGRTREDLIRQMEELARTDTPEWGFRAGRGDVGFALMSLYADMLEEMIRRYNRAPERDRQMFFRRLDAARLPAVPARGYVSFGLADRGVEGRLLPAGTGLIGDAQDGQPVRLETQKDIYVDGSRIAGIFYQDGERDLICRAAEAEGPVDCAGRENLQEHACWLGHSTVLCIGGEAEILIALTPRRDGQEWDTLLEDPEKTGFSYLSALGERSFEGWSCEKNTVRLKKTENMPDFAPAGLPGGGESCWIKWSAKEIGAYGELELSELWIGSVGAAQAPEYLYTADGQEALAHFYPFGERPGSFGEFYICSDEVFGKSGARIELTMELEFRRIAPLTEAVAPPVQWKTIMRPEDFPKPEELPVTVEEVIWEYYNGTGFTRLFPETERGEAQRAEAVFSPDRQREKPGEAPAVQVRMTFFCPDDIYPVPVNAGTFRCIRARILRMEHEYAVGGYYIAPFINGVQLSYDYRTAMKRPELCWLCNNLEEDWQRDVRSFRPFRALEEKRPALYIGFDRPLRGGPFGLYCGVKQRARFERRKWNCEYYNGREWVSPVLEDGTEGMTKSGTLTLLGNYDFEAVRLFGVRLFWLRLTELSESGAGRETSGGNAPGPAEEPCRRETEEEAGTGKDLPLQELWMNTVPVMAVETAPEEFFTAPASEEYPVCRLKQKNIQRLAVWVSEPGLDREEQERLEREARLLRVRNEDGAVSGLWVLWEETADVRAACPGDRSYSADRREGVLRLSPRARGRSVRAAYSWGGGARGNLAEGQVTRLSRSVRFLSRVVNRHALFGGKDQELPEEAAVRAQRRLCHRNRAVTASDYEVLALETAREVRRVKAFPNRKGTGEAQRGAVTLVVLQEDYRNADFHGLQEVLRAGLLNRMPGIRQLQSSLYIVEPWFTEVQVSAVCSISPDRPVFECRAEAERRLSSFLDPLTGNFDGRGWEIGCAPRREQLRIALGKTRGLEQIRRLSVKAYCRREGQVREIDLEGKLPEFLVVMSGSHRLQLEFSGRGA